MLVHNYVLFKMDANEIITDMSLPKTWEAKVTTIQEAKDLIKLPLKELTGSLMTYEIIMKEHLEDEFKKKKSIKDCFRGS
ncbi:UBN2 domain-containing protein [Cucumis melo var. makuwa]|uniref:UBN2 domain-containing protein n=1 Tax=Cucumis melo var. makuwa TaxID=1194695 RepID=A0A5D3CUY4_CUCMM|nr:UBN2 domain-containing protein [Cucumis melo var. makuwa]TYK14216.1 UBN2 domain-containing protein [Cucumis melo var. makuwa]